MREIKSLTVVLMAVMVFGCEPGEPKNESNNFILPPELEGCQIFSLNGRHEDLYVVRCPNSETTTHWSRNCGKNCWKHLNVTTTELGAEGNNGT